MTELETATLVCEEQSDIIEKKRVFDEEEGLPHTGQVLLELEHITPSDESIYLEALEDDISDNHESVVIPQGTQRTEIENVLKDKTKPSTTLMTALSSTPLPSFRRPTMSMLAPKKRESYEPFPDSPASRRGIMMKIATSASAPADPFDSIFLCDDTEQKKKDKIDHSSEDFHSVPTLYRPTKSSLALPQVTAEPNPISRRGTMMKTTGIQFTSKFALLVESAEKNAHDKAKNATKSPIPRDAFVGTRIPTHKGHIFDAPTPTKRQAVPVEAFKNCQKAPPLKDRIKVIAEQCAETPPKVMKTSVPFESFVSSPAKPPPVVDDKAPLTSLKQLYLCAENKALLAELSCERLQTAWTGIINKELESEIEVTKSEWGEEIEELSRYSRATPQRRMYKRALQTASSVGGCSALSTLADSVTLATEGDLMRSKKLMKSSLTTERHRSRHGMSRARRDCVKGIEHVKAFACEAIEVVRKLFNRHLAAIRKASQRLVEAYSTYLTALGNYSKLGPSPQKNAQQKRLHVIVNQQTTVMCSSLRSVEDTSSALKEIEALLQRERSDHETDEYCFSEVNPIHFFPKRLQEFFRCPVASPSTMRLASANRPPKKRRTRSKAKKKIREARVNRGDLPGIPATPQDRDDSDQLLFSYRDSSDVYDISGDADERGDALHCVDGDVNGESIHEDFSTAEHVQGDWRSTKRYTLVSDSSFTDYPKRDAAATARQINTHSSESVQSDMCVDESGRNNSLSFLQRQSSIIARQSVLDQGILESDETGNVLQYCHATEEHTREKGLIVAPATVSQKQLLAPIMKSEGCVWEGATAFTDIATLKQTLSCTETEDVVASRTTHGSDTISADNINVDSMDIKDSSPHITTTAAKSSGEDTCQSDHGSLIRCTSEKMVMNLLREDGEREETKSIVGAEEHRGNNGKVDFETCALSLTAPSKSGRNF